MYYAFLAYIVLWGISSYQKDNERYDKQIRYERQEEEWEKQQEENLTRFEEDFDGNIDSDSQSTAKMHRTFTQAEIEKLKKLAAPLSDPHESGYQENPCFGVPNVHFGTFSGFEFKNGTIYKIKIRNNNKTVTEAPQTYKSLQDFIEREHVCRDANSSSWQLSPSFADYAQRFFLKNR